MCYSVIAHPHGITLKQRVKDAAMEKKASAHIANAYALKSLGKRRTNCPPGQCLGGTILEFHVTHSALLSWQEAAVSLPWQDQYVSRMVTSLI